MEQLQLVEIWKKFLDSTNDYLNRFTGLCDFIGHNEKIHSWTLNELYEEGRRLKLIIGHKTSSYKNEPLLGFNSEGNQVVVLDYYYRDTVVSQSIVLNDYLQNYLLENANHDYLKKFLNKERLKWELFTEYRCLNEIASLKNALDTLTEIVSNENDIKMKTKIKWVGKAAHFGYIFSELVEQGFIEYPKTNGDQSMAKLAGLLFNMFDVNGTTIKNLEKEINPQKNTLGEFNRKKIIIPNISDLK